MSTWVVTKNFRLLPGSAFTHEAVNDLFECGLRRTGVRDFVYTTTVESETAAKAGIAADRKLIELIGPFGVTGHVYASQVVEVAGQ